MLLETLSDDDNTGFQDYFFFLENLVPYRLIDATLALNLQYMLQKKVITGKAALFSHPL